MRFLLSLLAAILCMTAPAMSCRAEGSSVTMLCLNAGKADCILLEVEGHHYLIDTGYKKNSDQLLDMLTHEHVDHLDGVFITHNHKDHYGGLTALYKSSVKIDAIYTSAYCEDGIGPKHPAVKAAALRGQEVQLLKSGDSVTITDTACFRVLAPFRLNTDNENNNSLVMRLETPHGNIMLTGDMKFEEEHDLLKSGADMTADVLKVAFHGDDTSTSSSFLSVVRPKAAVISTSTAEEKDTPSRSTLFRLASIGCKVYVTQDAVSAVRVTLSHGDLSVDMENWQQ